MLRDAFCKREQLMKTLCWAAETVRADPQVGDLDQLPHTSKAQGTRQKRRWKEFKSWRIGRNAVKCCLLDIMCVALMTSMQPCHLQTIKPVKNPWWTGPPLAEELLAAEGGRIAFFRDLTQACCPCFSRWLHSHSYIHIYTHTQTGNINWSQCQINTIKFEYKCSPLFL